MKSFRKKSQPIKVGFFVDLSNLILVDFVACSWDERRVYKRVCRILGESTDISIADASRYATELGYRGLSVTGNSSSNFTILVNNATRRQLCAVNHVAFPYIRGNAALDIMYQILCEPAQNSKLNIIRQMYVEDGCWHFLEILNFSPEPVSGLPEADYNEQFNMAWGLCKRLMAYRSSGGVKH